MSDKKKKYLQSLESRVNNISVLSNKMKNFSHGINDTKATDIRTQREKSADKNYIYQVLRTKVYDLFNNDAEMAEEFLELVTNSEVTPEQFSIAIPQLKLNYKGNIADPNDVMNNLRQLIQNFNESGTVSGSVAGSARDADETIAGETIKSLLDEVRSIVQEAFNNQKLSKEVGDEWTDVLSVIGEKMPESFNLDEEEQNRVDVAIEKLSRILESSGGSNLKKVAKEAKDDFHKLIDLLTSDKTMSISIVLEEFVDIVESIVNVSKVVERDTERAKERKITVPLQKEYMKKYGLKIERGMKFADFEYWVHNYEIDNKIYDGLYQDYIHDDELD